MGNSPGPTPRFDGLLGEGDLDERELDALTRWANERARQLVSEIDASDHELGALLRGGQPSAGREGSGLLGPLPPLPTSQGRSPAAEQRQAEARQARARQAQARETEAREAEEREAKEIDELEVLDEEDVELVDEGGDDGAHEDDPSSARTVVTPEPEPLPEWKAALQTVHEPHGDEHQGSPSESVSIRLESEPDDISKHDIDLSDLDGDPGSR